MTLWRCSSMGGLSPFRGPGGAPLRHPDCIWNGLARAGSGQNR
jgi:hypothetical protein